MGLTRRLNREIARQIAKRMPKGEFLASLKETWVIQIGQHGGSVDEAAEMAAVKKRIADSGQADIFKTAGVTEEDLLNTLHAAIAETTKAIKGLRDEIATIVYLKLEAIRDPENKIIGYECEDPEELIAALEIYITQRGVKKQ
jgi:DNA-directed RNA polymerase specialized sigma54-like protein